MKPCPSLFWWIFCYLRFGSTSCIYVLMDEFIINIDWALTWRSWILFACLSRHRLHFHTYSSSIYQHQFFLPLFCLGMESWNMLPLRVWLCIESKLTPPIPTTNQFSIPYWKSYNGSNKLYLTCSMWSLWSWQNKMTCSTRIWSSLPSDFENSQSIPCRWSLWHHQSIDISGNREWELSHCISSSLVEHWRRWRGRATSVVWSGPSLSCRHCGILGQMWRSSIDSS